MGRKNTTPRSRNTTQFTKRLPRWVFSLYQTTLPGPGTCSARWAPAVSAARVGLWVWEGVTKEETWPARTRDFITGPRAQHDTALAQLCLGGADGLHQPVGP